MAGALRASPTSLTKLFSLLRGALPGPIAAKSTASAVGTGEARRSAATECAQKLAAALASVEALRDARRAVPADLGLPCGASASGPHHTRKSSLFGLLRTRGDGLLQVLYGYGLLVWPYAFVRGAGTHVGRIMMLHTNAQ